MDLLWPKSLLLLAAIPILGLVYAWMLRRQKRYAVRYSSLALVRGALPRRFSWRRHLPFGLFLLALGSLVVALSRPYVRVSVPAEQAVIVLALDVSRSMCSTDIAPNRLEAAEQAALDFIRQQKPTTQVGVVAFSGFAEVVQSPTTDPERLQSAIQGLVLGSTTAIGSGILKSLDAIAGADPNVSPSQPVPDADISDGGDGSQPGAQGSGSIPALPVFSAACAWHVGFRILMLPSLEAKTIAPLTHSGQSYGVMRAIKG